MPVKPSSEPTSSPPDKSQVGGGHHAVNSSNSRRNVFPSSSGISMVNITVASTSTQHGAGRLIKDCSQGETLGDVPPPLPPPTVPPRKNKRKRHYSGVTPTQSSSSQSTKVIKMASGVGEHDRHSKVSKGPRVRDTDDPLEGPSSANQRSTPRRAPLPSPSRKVKGSGQAGAKSSQTPRVTQKRKMGSPVQETQSRNTGTADPSPKKKRHSEPSVEKTSHSSRPEAIFESCYTVGEVLGKGGYGCVFAGTRKSDGLQVAIKVIPREKVDKYITMPDSGVCLPLEVALMTIVSQPPVCPNIINLLEWFEGPTAFIFILERPIPCRDLFDHCHSLQSRFSESEAKHIMRQVVCAAKHCSDRGVLHRDIKLENLLITEDKTIKLIDFGCGDLLKETPYNTFRGTIGYSPPEWFLERSYQGQPATVWSLGVLLYALLCGRMPFVNNEQIVSGRLQFSRGLSCECRNIMHWCLRKNPAKRPALEQILKHKWLAGTD